MSVGPHLVLQRFIVKSSQVNDVPRTQTGHSLYVRITINVLHITSILFHVKLRSDTRIIVVLAF